VELSASPPTTNFDLKSLKIALGFEFIVFVLFAEDGFVNL